MSHEFETGFFVKDGAWHGLGTVVKGAPSVADAIKLAGLDWTVSMRPIALADGTPIDAGKGRAVVRQNASAFAWFDPFVQAGEATLETAGSLRNGERVWVLAKIGHNGDSHADIVPGDTIYQHLLLANGHDGTMAIHVGRVRTRVVCANTLRGALGEGTTMRVRHTAGAGETLDDIRDVMRSEHAAFAKDCEAYRALAKCQVTSATLREYVKAVFPETFKRPEDFKRARTMGGKVWRPEESAAAQGPAYVPPTGASLLDDLLGGEQASVSDASAIEAASDGLISPIYDRMVELVEVGRGAEIPGVRGTMWGAYNAAVEYMQYEQGRGPAGFTDRRADSMLFGAGATANGIALNRALDFARKAGVSS